MGIPKRQRTAPPAPLPPPDHQPRQRRPPRVAVAPTPRADLVFPPELDPAHYRMIHADLWTYALDEAAAHYAARGKAEGRQPNVLASREMFRDLAARLGDILEIGPFSRPLFRGPHVTYFDVLDRAGLTHLGTQLGLHEGSQIPDIHFVSATGDLTIVPGTFDVVASSHVIEHQPDLVRHLNQVAAVLKPGGYYFLWIPDKRYCLDHFQAESTIAGVLAAAAEQRTFHTLETLLAQDLLRAHNDSRRHWLGDHGGPVHDNPVETIRLVRDLHEASRARGEYVDRHAWQFTPDSFRTIVALLDALGLIALRPLRVYNTLFSHNEFWAILMKPG